MEKKTVQYKRTLRGSVGAGVGALFNGDGRRYYILEHKDASKYHKAGESQKIIIDQIELGRDDKCQVRFDDGFPTVSRKHAAIVKDGDGWKLVHLSSTNSTFLNGQSVSAERPLQNGDEIQLSVGGPRLGFLVPAGKQSLVSSIKITERLELFRKQALRPYKTAIACMFAMLVLVSAAGLYKINDQQLLIVDLMSKDETKSKELAELQRQNEEMEKQRIEDSIIWDKKLKERPRPVNPDEMLIPEIDRIKSSVYAVYTEVFVEIDGEAKKIALSQGTGFLTEDGKFVTARHCVEPWLFNQALNEEYAKTLVSEGLYKIYAVIRTMNKQNESFTLNSQQFTVDTTYDTPCKQHVTIGEYEFDLDSKYAFGSEKSLGNDWAYCNVQKKGAIKTASDLSKSLKSGTTVHMLGFPMGNGIGDGRTLIDPIYNKLSVSRDGLTNARCIMVNQGVDHGNSGGPVFALVNGKLQVVGIVSRGDHNSEYYNHLIPMCNLE